MRITEDDLKMIMSIYHFKDREHLVRRADTVNGGARGQVAALIEEVFRLRDEKAELLLACRNLLPICLPADVSGNNMRDKAVAILDKHSA